MFWKGERNMLIQAITLEINVVILIVLICLFLYVKVSLDGIKNTEAGKKKENKQNRQEK